MPDNHLFNADNATTLAPTMMSSSQLENQDTTHIVVTEYPSGNAIVSGNETFSLTNENLSVPEEKIAESTNATIGLVTSIMITSSNESITDMEIQRYEVDANNGLYVIYPAVAMSPGMYNLEIDYEILFDGKAIYSTSYSESSEGKSLIGTRLKPVRASHLLPIFDDVKLKAIFSASVVHPREARVLSNMPLNISKDISDDRVIDIFTDTPLLSPYNLAFIMGEIESVGETKIGFDNATEVTFWGDPKKRRSRGIYLLDKLDQIVVHLNDMFLMPYPLPKLDIVALPSRIVDNAGSPGLISLKQSLFYAADRSPMVTKTDALSALISLIGEQWLGGVVNMKNWTDIWLFEGSTLYLRHEMIEKAYNWSSLAEKSKVFMKFYFQIDSSLSSNLAFLANVQWEAMEEDSYSVSRPLQSNVNPTNLDFSDRNIRHKKGACLIRMLHGVINDTAFRNGYRQFIARWNYSTANVDDFWEAMAEEVIGLPMGITLPEAMNSWISHRGYPIVSVMRQYKEGTAIIRQQKFTYDQSSDIQPTWYVPLDYINKTSNDWSSPTKMWLHSETEMVVHNIGAQDSWIVFNVNKTGYYRVHYDEENWKLLIHALEENHEILPAETRASLIDDVLGLAAVGLTKYATAFDFIKYMQIKERHYAPWGILMRHLLKLNGLLYETSGFSAFQEFTLRFTSKLYADVGWKVDEGSRLTLTTLTIACAFENAECLDWARNHFAKLKDHSDADEVVPAYAREVLYCTIARYGTRNEWNYFVERINSTADRDEKNRLLSAFACFQTPWILQLILSEILEGKMYDEDEMQRILRSFPQNPVAAQIAYKFVQNNWQVIVTRFSKSRPILKAFALAMTNGLISEEDFEDNGIIVSSDEMWRKRRFSSFSSHSGLVTLIGWYISKINLRLLNKEKGHCRIRRMELTHIRSQANHTESAAKMDAIIEMFSRSEDLHNIKYVNYIGDGDSENLSRDELLNHCFHEKRLEYEQRYDKVILLYDNAHVAKVVKKYLETLKWDVLPHPPYFPDIVLSDCWLFRRMFTSFAEIENWLQNWIASKDESFFREGIRKLPERWEKVVDSDGQYFN
ncbi:Thyrotropin-releasing hormone-degrading ectoenzyme [Atta colombica]|uniref:Thyrotropin-releasing hormone-degrading ectoenzyme n=1 Tax=Atta colombica TaxID=520822 RepID=A0A195BLU6_9HYME|nr:Thyrotropin-releasing hormone-degrading ectoenzyme [Atta colombica]